MRLTRRWWEVGGEKPSYNFTTLATAADAALSLQQVSILKGGVEGGKGMLLIATCSTKPALHKCTDSLSLFLVVLLYLNYKLCLCIYDSCIIRTCRMSGPAGLVSLSSTLR